MVIYITILTFILIECCESIISTRYHRILTGHKHLSAGWTPRRMTSSRCAVLCDRDPECQGFGLDRTAESLEPSRPRLGLCNLDIGPAGDTSFQQAAGHDYYSKNHVMF